MSAFQNLTFPTTGLPTTKSSSTKVLLLTGGTNDNFERLSSNEVYPASMGCSPPPLPGKGSQHTTFLTAGNWPVVATCGGLDGDQTFASCLVLDSSTGMWEEDRMGPLLHRRHWHATVTLDQHVFIIGGQGGQGRGKSMELLPADSMTWIQGPQIPVEMRLGP